MKKSSSFHIGETLQIALFAIGFVAFIMLLSYLYWFA